MDTNVAGTNAVAGYLVSEIANTRTLFGLSPLTTAQSAAQTSTGIQGQVLAQQLADAQTLFGSTPSSEQSAGLLPPDPTETPRQLAVVAIQSATIASEFANIATLFGSLGLGTNTNAEA